MNALLRKEIRLLMPSFPIALALSWTPGFLPYTTTPAGGLESALVLLPWVAFPAAVVLMALDTFGREISGGTFAHLLAQPLARMRVWRVKTALLAGAIGLVVASWWFGLTRWAGSTWDPEARGAATLGAALFGVAAFSGALWSVLLLRQVVAAFWFTCLVPALLALSLGHLLADRPQAYRTAVSAAILAYGAAGFFWGRHLFLRAQDVSWTGGVLTWPGAARRAARATPADRQRHRRPYRALLAKELRLHQSTLLVAALVALVHLAIRVARAALGPLPDLPVVEFMLGEYWLFWLFMPVLAGCAAAAEERKLGTHDQQLCWPVSPRHQWAVKGIVVLGLAIGLGAGMPLLLDFAQVTKEVGLSYSQFLVAIFSLTFVSFYASTMARSTLQALAPAAFGLVLVWALILTALAGPQIAGHLLWQGPLVAWIGAPVLVLTILGLMLHNYRQTMTGAPLWRRNAAILGSSLLGIALVTGFLYHRTWELGTSIEPAHGMAVFLRPQPAALQISGNAVIARRPDGTFWVNRLIPAPGGGLAGRAGEWSVVERVPGGRVLTGTNWVRVVAASADLVAIAQDGSLWKSTPGEGTSSIWQPATGHAGPVSMIPLGSDRDWKDAAVVGMSLVLLKGEGSLWKADLRAPGLLPAAFQPQRLGDAADWGEMGAWAGRLCLWKQDGAAWAGWDTGAERLVLDERLVLHRRPQLDRPGWKQAVWTNPAETASVLVGIRDDGTFRVNATWEPRPSSETGPWLLAPQDARLGDGQDWLDVAGDWGKRHPITLRADGSLWKWTLPANPSQAPERAVAAHLGAPGRWVAVEPVLGGTLALAADGHLWFWEAVPRSANPFTERLPWLGPSRRPQHVGRVL